jgi:Flp pilus assembly protein TadD
MRLSIPFLIAGLAALGLTGCGASNIASVPGNVPGVRIADAALEAGNPVIALRVTDGLLAVNPNDTEALLRAGKADAMLGQDGAAEKNFRHLLTLDPGNRTAQLGLAKAVLFSNPAEAEKLYVAYLAHDPRNTDALNNLGVARDMQAHHAEAQIAYRKALAIAPDLDSARENLGLSLAMSGQASEGVAMIGQVAKDGTNDRRTRDNFALALDLAGHSAEADKMLREELSPADAQAALTGYSEFSSNRSAATATP